MSKISQIGKKSSCQFDSSERFFNKFSDQESIFLSEIDMSEVHCGKTRYLVVSEQLPSGETIRLLFDRKSPERYLFICN